MMSARLGSVEEYCSLLDRSHQEMEDLFHDLLIGVTEFFRDPKAFQYLQDVVIPGLLEERRGDEVRMWSAGCSTGEEAYSLAILMNEAVESAEHEGNVTIFASDVHRRSLEQASTGIFEKDRLKNVTTERLEKHFLRSRESYLLCDEVRDMVVFDEHNLIADPPMSKMDLIACRNVLIYLRPEVQERVVSSLLAALNDGGYLFLGSSENVWTRGTLEPVDRTLKVFRRSTGGVHLEGRFGRSRSEILHIPDST